MKSATPGPTKYSKALSDMRIAVPAVGIASPWFRYPQAFKKGCAMAFMTLTVLLVVVLAAVMWARSGRSAADAVPQLRRVGMLIAGIVLFFMVTSSITIVKAGHVGVVDVFGRVSTATLKA